MIATDEVIRILEHEEIPEEEQEHLENLLQERAEEALKEYSKNRGVVITVSTGIEELVDSIDLSEKMREVGSSADIGSLIHELIVEKAQELAGLNGYVECNIVDNK